MQLDSGSFLAAIRRAILKLPQGFHSTRLTKGQSRFLHLASLESCIKLQSPFPTPSNAASVADFTYNNWSLKDKKWQLTCAGLQGVGMEEINTNSFFHPSE